MLLETEANQDSVDVTTYTSIKLNSLEPAKVELVAVVRVSQTSNRNDTVLPSCKKLQFRIKFISTHEKDACLLQCEFHRRIPCVLYSVQLLVDPRHLIVEGGILR